MYNRFPRKAVTRAFEADDDDDDDDDHDDDGNDDVNDDDYEKRMEASKADENEADGETVERILENLLKIREKCHLRAKENIIAAQQKQKKQYDQKHNSLKVRQTSSIMIQTKVD